MTECNPGDRVFVFSPFYENYTTDEILSGAETAFVTLCAPRFDFDSDAHRKTFETKPKALILCNRSNATGKVF